MILDGLTVLLNRGYAMSCSFRREALVTLAAERGEQWGGGHAELSLRLDCLAPWGTVEKILPGSPPHYHVLDSCFSQ